jgi:hypothetical protein
MSGVSTSHGDQFIHEVDDLGLLFGGERDQPGWL